MLALCCAEQVSADESNAHEAVAAAAAKAAAAADAAKQAVISGAAEGGRAASKTAQREPIPYDSLPPRWAAEICVT